MNHVFASSHLPEDNRPLEDEEEEEDEDVQPMLRAGGVRALSHLRQRARDEADFTEADRDGSPWRGIAPLPPRSATSTSRAPSTPGDQDDPPPPNGGHEDDTRAHDYADDHPWHMPRISLKDLQAQGYAGIENPLGSGPAFEPGRAHLHPAADAQAAFLDLTNPIVHDESAHEGLFRKPAGVGSMMQLLASTGTGPAKPLPQPMIIPVKPRSPLGPPENPKPKPDPAPAPDPGRDTPPGKEQGRPAAPPPAAPPAVPHPLTVHGADESAPGAQGRTFGDTVRSIMRAEAAGSATATALMQHAVGLSKKQIIIKKTTNGEAWSEIGPDGSIIVHINPKQLKVGTLSHEISHAIQGWHLEQAKRKKMAETGSDKLSPKEMDAAIMAGRRELHSVVKVATPADGMEGTTEYRENEAVRSGNVVTAEITAAEVRAEIEALKKTNPAEYKRLTGDPSLIVEKFWRKQLQKEGVGHEKNKRPIPKGTRYGLYDYAPVLRSLGHGVTQEHLKQWRQKNVGGH